MKLSSFARPRSFAAALLLAVFAFAVAPAARAQEEGAPTVVDEAIAQVNNDVITLSMLKRETKAAFDAIRQSDPTLSDAQINEKLSKSQPELIASLINESLLLQRGKELDLANDVEAQVNREILGQCQKFGITKVEDCDAAMRQQGLDPNEIRQTLRIEIMKNAVLNREVDAKIFYGISTEEARKYYEANRAKFTMPETLTVSEIFLSSAGRPEADVRAKAARLAQQARSGADFGALAAANSERIDRDGKRIAQETKGKLGTFVAEDIKVPAVAAALKNAKKGDVTDPIRTDEGYMILRVDDRTPSGEMKFEEMKVRERMTYERAEKERRIYLAKLRKESYIAVAPAYKDTVMPLLTKDDQTTTANNYLSPIRRIRKPDAKKN